MYDFINLPFQWLNYCLGRAHWQWMGLAATSSWSSAALVEDCHHRGYHCSLHIAQYRALTDATASEGDRKRMREARTVSTYQVTQKDLFLMFRKMFGVQNDYIKESNLFLSFNDGSVYQRNWRKFTLTSTKFASSRGEKMRTGEEKQKKWELGLCLALLTVIGKVVLICLWTDEVKALLLEVLHCQ